MEQDSMSAAFGLSVEVIELNLENHREKMPPVMFSVGMSLEDGVAFIAITEVPENMPTDGIRLRLGESMPENNGAVLKAYMIPLEDWAQFNVALQQELRRAISEAMTTRLRDKLNLLEPRGNDYE